MRKRSWTNEDLKLAIKESLSIRQVLDKLKLKPTGGNYEQFRKYAKELDIDTSHFTGQGWNVGLQFVPNPALSLNEICVEYSTYASNHLRKRLLKEKVFPHQCTLCKRKTWMKQPVPLELDHINGIKTDHRLENLRLLCPNCHAQTDNYRGKNKNTY